MADRGLILGVDGGGTGCRARLADGAGRALGEGRAGPANVRFGLDAAFAAAAEAARGALAAAGIASENLDGIAACLGLAGATEPGLLARARRRPHPFGRTLVTSDAHVACVGAHGGRDGAVIVVGTGSCGFAVLRGRMHQVGGWGFPLSDEGSGAWLGAELLRRALRAADGRIARTTLLDEVLARHGGAHGITGWMTGASPRDYAALAPGVVEAAGRGDPEAASLIREAAAHVDAVASRLAGLGAERIALVGGLSPHVAPWLAAATRDRLVPPLGDALDGALGLARAAGRAGGDGEDFATDPPPGAF